MFNEVEASEQEDVKKAPKKKHKVASGKKGAKKGKKKRHGRKKVATKKA